MKKFCDKLTKKERWRITVPNLNSPSTVFRKTSSIKNSKSFQKKSPSEESKENQSDKNSKRSSGFYDFQEAQLEFDKCQSLPNSVYIESACSSSSAGSVQNNSDDDENEEKFHDAQENVRKSTASETETDQETYVDVMITQMDAPSTNIDRNNSKFEYDVPKITFKFFEKEKNETEILYENDRTMKSGRSEVHIVLQQPELDPHDEVELEKEEPQENNEEIELAESVKSHPSETFSSQDEILVRRSRETIPVASPIRKSGSDPTLIASSLSTKLNNNSNAISETTAVRSASVAAEEEDDNEENFYKVPRCLKVKHRLSQSLNDFDPENMNHEEIIIKSNSSSIEHISCSQVNLAKQNLALNRRKRRSCSPNDSEKLDYCKTRSRLPISIRRPTLLRKPKNPLDSWNTFKTRMTDETKTVFNFEEIYKNSKSKCKQVLKNTGKIISKVSPGKKSGHSDNVSDVDSTNSPIIGQSCTKGDSDCFKLKATDIEYKLNTDPKHNNNNNNSDESSPEIDDEKIKEEFDFSSIKNAFKKKLFIPESQNGFEDLKRYVKQGSDFCKELAAILQERAEAESQYAKNLSKLSAKLSRACRDGIGGINEAWKAVALELEAKAEAHRITAQALQEETAKPLRNMTESQHRVRKQCEATVDKASRLLSDWRTAEAKGKKHSHACARDNEKLQDAAVYDTTKFGKQTLSKSTSLIHLAHRQNSVDKENAKLEGKKKKAEDAVKKADIEYYTLCVRAERARLEWESAVLKGVNTFQSLEDERLNNLKVVLLSYFRHNDELHPKIFEAVNRLKQPISDAEPVKDLSTFHNLRQMSQQISEQLLPDFYCEHITLAMNRERRKQALIKLLHLIRQDIERERKSKNGLENLSKAIKQTPNFGTEDSQQSVVEKLYHMKSMLTYLEGARYKVQSALAELDSGPRIGHPLAPHITITRDKSGLQQSVLKVPQWLKDEFVETNRSPISEKSLRSDKSDNSDPHINDVDDNVTSIHDEWNGTNDRGTADGNSNQPDSDFDEFSSQCSSNENPAEAQNIHPIAKCRAIYPYTPNLPDELLLSPGDVLQVYRQQDDGWWLGECNGNVGIFPATYVEIVT